MAIEAKPECACGDTSAITSGKKRIIFPCVGTANVGQISNTAAFQLADEGYGIPACLALLGADDTGLKQRIAEAEEVIIIDGCSAACGARIAAARGVNTAQHIIITDLGIGKAYSRNFTDDDVETVVSAVWVGIGR